MDEEERPYFTGRVFLQCTTARARTDGILECPGEGPARQHPSQLEKEPRLRPGLSGPSSLQPEAAPSCVRFTLTSSSSIAAAPPGLLGCSPGSGCRVRELIS